MKQAVKCNAKDAVLIVVDIQEKLLPHIDAGHELIKSCETLIKGCRISDVPIICTQQYTKGLGQTIPSIVEAISIAPGSPTENTLERRTSPEFSFIEKTSFSVMGEPEFRKSLNDVGRRQIILCGIEAHVCVLQSALDFLNEDFAVFLISDAVSSRRARDRSDALSRAVNSGAISATAETVLFELTEDAKHPAFKEISKLVK
ncbi:MAG: isochorismatase family protein [Clostridiales Family XIII bacterium]|jgi:nicotinamidase-related amidase|nr:isochorismatase family protein [Clostridiales Family XIII bacterium]